MGRFISESPIAPMAEEEYVFCGNDPVNYVDINGLKRTLRERAIDLLAGPIEYVFDRTLKPILDNIIPQNRPNTPPGLFESLFPAEYGCDSVDEDLGDLSTILASGIIDSAIESVATAGMGLALHGMFRTMKGLRVIGRAIA